jgi:hypothetical protein
LGDDRGGETPGHPLFVIGQITLRLLSICFRESEKNLSFPLHLPRDVTIGEEFEQLQPGKEIYGEVVLSADSGFHSEASVGELMEQGIEAYVADRKFRQL